METQLRLSRRQDWDVESATLSETDQTSFIYRAENKPAVPTGFAVGWKWTLITADLKRNTKYLCSGKI